MFSKPARFLSIFVLVVSLFLPLFSWAETIEDITFSDSYSVGSSTLPLHGTGLLRYKIIFKVYVAALYLGPGVRSEEALLDVPKRLEIHYFHKISKQEFIEAADVGLAAHFSKEHIQKLQPKIAQINALYGAVKPGDRYALTYIPGTGTELALNGLSKGVVKGAEFAQDYFSIWLGPHAIDPSLRKQLLRQR